MLASLIVGGVFVLAMVIASVRGAVVLPADARIPVHAGSVERCYLVPKRAGLVIWPGAGALVFGLLGGVAASSLAADWTASVRTVLMPAVVGVLLAFQVGALAIARRGMAAGREVNTRRGAESGREVDTRRGAESGREVNTRRGAESGREMDTRREVDSGHAGDAGAEGAGHAGERERDGRPRSG